MDKAEDLRSFYARNIKADQDALPMFESWKAKMITERAPDNLRAHLDKIVAETKARIAQSEERLAWLKSEFDRFDP